MMSTAAAPNAATPRIGTALPTGLIGARAPVRAIRDAEDEDAPETSPEEGALLVAVEAGLREAGYLPA
ncbi:hypothetical protein SAMN02799631_03731 [Methylobacterium sp. 174MFSha1.1]|uniref:hypothetical protein n=1 Tax=Methylobacterium sp. 174MFSha1.1 TaxID=1502749 RepID=UPI0008E88045|nr:hypothetical protein [Methylobacterium sp. 174MFSha1.1]SFU99525.1 hypothetical protein SAMN02799631_03731 [Methylobacterium sp. 174MFSha1.1]